MPSPLLHELPMRWADLDELSHVNNVVYLDYAAEARAAHVAAGELPDGPVGAIDVEFLRPLLLSRTPVRVVSVLQDDGALVQEIAPVDASSPFARVTSGPVAEPSPHTGGGEPFDLRVRRSDLGPDGTVTTTKLFEYVQEARIVAFARLVEAGQRGRFVVAKVDLVPGRPVRWRPEPYRAETQVTHVGRSSIVVSTLVEGGLHGRADAVLVGFDPDTQSSRPITDGERAVLTAR